MSFKRGKTPVLDATEARLLLDSIDRHAQELPQLIPLPAQDETLLRDRFAELGPTARRFLDGLLLRDQRCGKAGLVPKVSGANDEKSATQVRPYVSSSAS